MSRSLEVILLGIGMFVSTFLVGYLPTKLRTSQRIMSLIAIFGAGLLVGAALVVIIPEGMLVLFSSLQAVPPNTMAHSHVQIHEA